MAVIGADHDDDWAGSAYVYRYDGESWAEEAKLTASDAGAIDFFGDAVSISGNLIVVGAWGSDDACPENPHCSSGAVYVYRYDGGSWTEEAKLTASDATESDFFGDAVSISGNLVVVGAWGNDDACPEDPSCNSGSAYVYRYDGGSWVEEVKLTAYDAAADDRFGGSVSVSGNVAVIGAPYGDDAGSDSGSAYVYRYDGGCWVEDDKLTASDAVWGDGFGNSVSVSGDLAVVGASHDDVGDINSGSAYVYRYDGEGWAEEAKLTASDVTGYDYFGGSVSVSGDLAVIGAAWNDDAGSHSGSAHVYRYDGESWAEEVKLTASDAAADDYFGGSVSVSGDLTVIGVHWDDDGGNNSGSAYAFAVNSPDCNGNSIPDECDIAAETSQDCNGDGIPDECVAPAPSIDISPADQAVCEGDTAVFTVVAMGSGTLHYQWRQDGVDVGDDDATLTLENVPLSDDGRRSPARSPTTAARPRVSRQR